MGPLEIFFSWQPILIAVLVYMATQLIKATIDASYGREKRKANRVLTRVVLPALPPALGAFFAVAVPMRPQSLVDYVQANELSWFLGALVFAAWGAACGQFADYTYSKVKDLVQHDDRR